VTTPHYRKSIRAILLGTTLALFTQPIIGGASSVDVGPVNQNALGISANFGKHTDGYIFWVYDPDNAPPGWDVTDDAVAAFQAAIDEWAGVCNLKFIYAGVDNTAVIGPPYDGLVVFRWDTSIAPAAGQAGPASTNSTEDVLGRWTYYDGSLTMNPDSFAFAGGTAAQEARNKLSFQAVAVHELGHLIGLGHSDRPDSIMFANPYNSITHITGDDIQVCRAIYGYSDVYKPRDKYTPPATASTRSYAIDLTEFGVQNPPLPDVDDGTEDGATQIAVLYFNTATNPADVITQEIVDPHGYLSSVASTNSSGNNGNGGWFTISTFARIRELPGVWTYYVSDSTGLIGALTIDVQVPLPAVNEPPTATFSFTENPATRDATLTTNVTGDLEGDLATIIWHIPGQSPITNDLGASSGVDVRNVDLNTGLDNEIFVEVNDDDVRYDPPGSGGTNDVPGSGFQQLFRYSSLDSNHGPDLDGDNSSDIVWRNSQTGQNWFYSMHGNLPAISTHIDSVGVDWSIVGLGDYNGDGKSDILLRNGVTGQLWMYLMDGSSKISSSLVTNISNLDWKVVGNGDYNGDGNSDILLRNDVSGQLWMYQMQGSTIATSSFVRNLSTSWYVAGSGDQNGDGNSDILIRNSGTGQNWAFFMNGATILAGSGPINTVSNQNSSIVGNADVDGDGDADLVWFNPVNGKVWTYLMSGTTIDLNIAIATVLAPGWNVVGSGDYNGDGKADILWRNSLTGQNWVFLMDSGTVIASTPINTVNSPGGWQIVRTN